MRLNDTKLIIYLIVISSLIVVSFYFHKLTNDIQRDEAIAMHKLINTKKEQSELLSNQLILFLKYADSRVESTLKQELKLEVNLAYVKAYKIYDKYRSKKSSKEIQRLILDSLSDKESQNSNTQVFVTDFNSNMILKGSQNIQIENFANYVDYDNRSIILEEIQKVRRRGEGYLFSTINANHDKELIFVKNLRLFDWFLGANTRVKDKVKTLKNDFLELIKSFPTGKSEFIGVFEGEKKIYLSEALSIDSTRFTKEAKWYKINNYYYYSRYYKRFNWYIIYGFKIKDKSRE